MPTRDFNPKSDVVTADPVHFARKRPAGTALTCGKAVRLFTARRKRAETRLVGWGGRIRTYKFQIRRRSKAGPTRPQIADPKMIRLRANEP